MSANNFSGFLDDVQKFIGMFNAKVDGINAGKNLGGTAQDIFVNGKAGQPLVDFLLETKGVSFATKGVSFALIAN